MGGKGKLIHPINGVVQFSDWALYQNSAGLSQIPAAARKIPLRCLENYLPQKQWSSTGTAEMMESAFLEIFKPRLDKVLSNIINFDIGLALSRGLDQMTYRGPFPPIIFWASRWRSRKSI